MKSQLMLALGLSAFVPFLALSIFNFTVSRRAREVTLVRSQLHSAESLAAEIDNRVSLAERLSARIAFHDDLSLLLNRRREEAMQFDETTMRFLDYIEGQYTHDPVTEHLLGMLILGRNGLDLRTGEGFLLDRGAVTEKRWYRERLDPFGAPTWGRVQSTGSHRTSQAQMIPMVRVVRDLDTGVRVGRIILLFAPSLLSDSLERYAHTVSDVWVYTSQDEVVLATGREVAPESARFAPLPDATEGGRYAVERTEGETIVFTSATSPQTGWRLVISTPGDTLRTERLAVLVTTGALIASAVVLSALLSAVLSAGLTKPMRELTMGVQRFAAGNLDEPVALPAHSELRGLAATINAMSREIRDLIEQNRKREREGRRLELDVLRNQINPHFVYNTLNTIRWMAVLHGSPGIETMVTSFGRLLKSVYQHDSEVVPLAEELRLAEDYMHILRIRYRGKVSYSVTVDESLARRAGVVKFVLQPLIENAVFHGIEPKAGAGAIRVEGEEADDALVLRVTDDGVGIDDERLATVLSDAEGEEEPSHHRGFQHVGLRNVHRRVRLLYGDSYGVRVASVPGRGTVVTVRMPILSVEPSNV